MRNISGYARELKEIFMELCELESKNVPERLSMAKSALEGDNLWLPLSFVSADTERHCIIPR